jgi:predicted ATPase
MHKVNKIRLAGFRRLREIEIEMRPLMVLIGANSVGKTSILDAAALLAASAAGKLNTALNSLGGVAEVSTRGQSKKITLEAEMECPGCPPLHYQLEVEAKGQGYAIPLESLTQSNEVKHPGPFKHIESHYDDIKYFDPKANKIVRPDWEHNPLESYFPRSRKCSRSRKNFDAH